MGESKGTVNVEVLAVVLILMLMAGITLLAAQGQEVTRGLVSSPQVIPIRGTEMIQIDWGQLAAMIGVIGALLGFIQWMILQAILKPALESRVDLLKKWAVEMFPSKGDLREHALKDENHQGHMNDIASTLTERSKESREQIGKLDTRVLRLEQRKGEA